MNHKKHLTNHQLQGILDQVLEDSTRLEINAHLDQCQECQAELASLENAILRISKLSDLELDLDFSGPILDQLREEEEIPSGITWTILLEAIGAGTVIGLLIPALRAAPWLPRFLDTQNEIQAAVKIYFTQLASSWLVWWAGIQMELDQFTQALFSKSTIPDLSFSPWILILAAGAIGVFINYLILRFDPGSIQNLNRNSQS